MRYNHHPPPGPTAGIPKKPTNTPAKVMAGHLMSKIGRPSRSRRSLLLSLVLVLAILCLVLGRRHADDLHLAAATLSSYVPERVTNTLAHHIEGYEATRWDDVVETTGMGQDSVKKPKFHLLIPYNKPTANLCKTMLSAALLNYPPPTLISYGSPGGSERPGADILQNMFDFLLGREAHDDDLILVVEEDAWFQLPAEVTISRFFHGMRDSSNKLVEKYGTVKDMNSTVSKPMYVQKVLFGAAKECSNELSEPACAFVPESPLPNDIYGDETDKHVGGKYNRPSYMGSSMVMGHVSDLRPIYKQATELLQFNNIGTFGSQYVFSKIFGEQEVARQIYAASESRKESSGWPSSFTSKPSHTSIVPNITLPQDKDYEFGIGLDYQSSIFQVMNNSAEDIRFITFNAPSTIPSPSKLAASIFAKPISLPPDLIVSPLPYAQHTVSSPNPNPPITALDTIDSDEATWNDVSLATNVIVPGSSVPTSLTFRGSESLLSQLWESMWFFKNSRALMRLYIRSPDGPIAAKAAAGGGDQWWDLRGGKGGVWTDKGQWLEWNEVCGTFDEEVFRDGKGEFGKESEEVGGQKVVYNAFGQVVEGKVSVEKPVQEEEKEEDGKED